MAESKTIELPGPECSARNVSVSSTAPEVKYCVTSCQMDSVFGRSSQPFVVAAREQAMRRRFLS